MHTYDDLCSTLDTTVHVDQLAHDYLNETFIIGLAEHLNCDPNLIYLNAGKIVVGRIEHTKGFELNFRIQSQTNQKNVLIDSLQLVFKIKKQRISNPRLIFKLANKKYSLREELDAAYQRIAHNVVDALYIHE